LYPNLLHDEALPEVGAALVGDHAGAADIDREVDKRPLVGLATDGASGELGRRRSNIALPLEGLCVLISIPGFF
jgi:hypothetical protein